MMTVCKLHNNTYNNYVASLLNCTESISLHVTAHAEEMVRYQIVVKYVGLNGSYMYTISICQFVPSCIELLVMYT